MTTYARLVDGFALDCQVAECTADLSGRYHPEWFSRQSFVVVPDGTIHGAENNGDGTFTNPSLTLENIAPIELSDIEKLQAIVTAIAGKVGVDVQQAVDSAAAARGA